MVQLHYPEGYPSRNLPKREGAGRKINRFVEYFNAHAQPFTWTATADSILEKVKKTCQHICETEH